MIPSESLSHPYPKGEIPWQLLEIATGPMELVWVNDAGGYTVRTDGVRGVSPGSYFVKWNPSTTGLSLATEVEKVRWLASKGHPTSTVVDFRNLEDGELLIFKDEGAISAVFPEWVDKPDVAIRAIATGLRQLHSIPIEECPYTWSIEDRLALVKDEGVRGRLAADAPPIDRLVVCHGDACAPNTLIRPDGSFAATIDLEYLGVADRWADLAVTILSLDWNYPKFDEGVFWETYGIEPDPLRMAYYRELWDAE